MNKIFRIFLALFLFVLLTGCKNKDKTLTFPAYDLSYSQHIYPLLNLRCAQGGCHNTTSHAAGIDFERGFITTDDYKIRKSYWIYPLVTPGVARQSTLYLILADSTLNYSPGLNQSMPPLDSQYDRLNADEINAVYTWINEGAHIHN